MITENLSTLKIHKLTQAQYERVMSTGNIDTTALYLTPEEDFATKQYVADAIASAIRDAIGGSY